MGGGTLGLSPVIATVPDLRAAIAGLPPDAQRVLQGLISAMSDENPEESIESSDDTSEDRHIERTQHAQERYIEGRNVQLLLPDAHCSDFAEHFGTQLEEMGVKFTIWEVTSTGEEITRNGRRIGNTGLGHQQTPFHYFVEYDGMVFDNSVNASGPIPLDEFLRSLESTGELEYHSQIITPNSGITAEEFVRGK